MASNDTRNKQGMYQIKVQGSIDERWSAWFEDLTIAFGIGSDGAPITTLAGPVADQAALRGILNKLWDLNLTLISITWASDTLAQEERQVGE